MDSLLTMEKAESCEEKALLNFNVRANKIEVTQTVDGKTVNLTLGFSHADMGIPYAASMNISEKETIKGFVRNDILFIKVGKVVQ